VWAVTATPTISRSMTSLGNHRRHLQYSLGFLFILTLFVAGWLALRPRLQAYFAIRSLSNSDLSVDGNYFGLDVRITGDGASTLEGLGKPANPWLLDALNDPNRFAAAHVLLTRINMAEYQLSAAEWNHLKIDLFADGTTDFHSEQIQGIIDFWNRHLESDDG
jgi:hypothetical protein